MVNNWVNAFGGAAVKPSQPSYEAITLTANITLSWPTEMVEGNPYVASEMDINATTTGLSVAMPNAMQGSTGQATVVRATGSNFTLTDNLGNTIILATAGVGYLISLTNNTTQAGTWTSVQMGGTSSGAGALAGPGLQASGSELETAAVVTPLSANTLITSSYRAQTINWTGAVGTLQLDTLTNLGSNWYASFVNNGTGIVTISTSSSQTINGATSYLLGVGAAVTIASASASGSAFVTPSNSVSPGNTYYTSTVSVPIVNGTGNDLSIAQCENAQIILTGALTAVATVNFPAGTAGMFLMTNNTTGGWQVTVASLGGGTSVALPSTNQEVYTDGINVVLATPAQTSDQQLELSRVWWA